MSSNMGNRSGISHYLYELTYLRTANFFLIIFCRFDSRGLQLLLCLAKGSCFDSILAMVLLKSV